MNGRGGTRRERGSDASVDGSPIKGEWPHPDDITDPAAPETELVEVAEHELTRTLTDQECQQYLHVPRCGRR